MEILNFKNCAFQNELQKRLQTYLDHKNQKGQFAEEAKAVILLFVVGGSYVSLIFFRPSLGIALPLLLVLALGLLGLGLNAFHEACHGNLSKHRWFNTLFALGFDVFGGISSTQYRFKHNVIHHRFTNLNSLDSDLDNVSILRLAPGFERFSVQRYQAFYAPALYLLLTATWLFNDLERLWTKRCGQHRMPEYSAGQVFIQILLKCIYIFLALAVPILIFGWVHALLGFLFVHSVMGFLIALIFQVAHVVEECEFPRESTLLPYSRFEHQLRTTANFANGTFWDFWLGGLNYQIEHHLFPNLSYRHFPAVSKIVKEVAEAYGKPYHSFPTFRSAVASHFRHVKSMGRVEESTRLLSR